tara:strand:+ start:1685 stop:2299 length:615 start_codon:yes stop_codon:yes gene_type:complete
MKEILITASSHTKHDETYFSVDSNWFEYFENYKVILLPNDIGTIQDYLEHSKPSAIVLSGGGNVKKNKLSDNDYDKNREKVEEFLIDYSVYENIALIAVCRGMQKVLSYLEIDTNFVKNNIKIKENYDLENSLIPNNKENKNRTCFNNYSISHNKKFDDRWIILCTDRFNNLLSLRHKKYKILCFMWHPERDFTDHDLVKSIIN